MTLAVPPELVPFRPEHLKGALRLSQEAGWPHRIEDWALTLSASDGVVAMEAGQVVGTALCSTFGDVATLSMIIVDASMRGRGLGRKLMEAVIAKAGTRELRLTATADGLPLYEKLGFRAVGQIAQHQGVAISAPPERPVRTGDMTGLAAMDHAASGLARQDLLDRIASGAEVLVADGGFALLRAFGRGHVAGPIVARDDATARALLSEAACRCDGTFLRVDLRGDTLRDHATALGLIHAGGGTAMVRDARPVPSTDFTTYALVSQALG